jgi:hypothetical protein
MNYAIHPGYFLINLEHYARFGPKTITKFIAKAVIKNNFPNCGG